MNQTIKEDKPKILQLIKALFQCTMLFCIPTLIITFFAPAFTIHLTRVEQDRVEAVVTKKLIFIVPVSRDTLTNVIDVVSNTYDGGLIREGGSAASVTGRVTGRAEDEGLLLLKSSEGEQIEVWVSPKNLFEAWTDVEYFVKKGVTPSLNLWVVSNWKFGIILPGGILLFCLIVFFMAAWSIITGKPLERKRSAS